MPRRPAIHRPPGRAAANKAHTKEIDRQRGSSSARGYGARWQKARRMFLAANPLCIDCTAEGRVTPATEVDHDTPHRGDHDLFWNEANWRARCKPHHSSKTAREDGGFGHARA